MVLEGLFGGAPHPVRPLEHVPIARLYASTDSAIVLTSDGQCLRLALDVAGAGANRVDAVPLPDGARATSGAGAVW